MLVSHESPLCLLEKSRTYNDYSYALVHLFEKYTTYYDFFKHETKLGRKVILDNSIFELCEAFESSAFAKWIIDLNPTEYIVPDVFHDANKTIENFDNWLSNYNDLKGVKIGVIQGVTYQDMVDCYLYMKDKADKIAINFDSRFFRNIGYSLDKNATIYHRIMNGRLKFVKELINDNIWDWNKPHHLLGATLPQEFKEYRSVKNIVSIDTSNPIVAGMHNIRYNTYGLNDKITIKLADILEQSVSDEQLEIILYNVQMFRKINFL